mmetsp:Transcript_32363/g.78738  ORF Transcript_32363/g.78738 Transcript_32363/m.78738 type:complete len:328 (-) Transcript_32363:151-1134(-)
MIHFVAISTITQDHDIGPICTSTNFASLIIAHLFLVRFIPFIAGFRIDGNRAEIFPFDRSVSSIFCLVLFVRPLITSSLLTVLRQTAPRPFNERLALRKAQAFAAILRDGALSRSSPCVNFCESLRGLAAARAVPIASGDPSQRGVKAPQMIALVAPITENHAVLAFRRTAQLACDFADFSARLEAGYKRHFRILPAGGLPPAEEREPLHRLLVHPDVESELLDSFPHRMRSVDCHRVGLPGLVYVAPQECPSLLRTHFDADQRELCAALAPRRCVQVNEKRRHAAWRDHADPFAVNYGANVVVGPESLPLRVTDHLKRLHVRLRVA